MNGFNSAPLRSLGIFLTLNLFSSCNITPSESTANTKSDYQNGKVYAKVSEGETSSFLLSTDSNQSEVGVCTFSDGNMTTCKSGQVNFIKAEKTSSVDGRNFFRINGVNIDSENFYQIINAATGDPLGRIKFVPVESADPVATGLVQINEEQMRRDLHNFSSDDMNGRLAGTEDNEKAAAMIVSELKALGINPARGSDYMQPFKMTVGPMTGKNTSNIVAILPGQDPVLKDEYIIIGAHMDHAGTLSRGYTCSKNVAGSNSICNGADDNGSGTIAVLHVAKALASVRHSLKRSVIIMWFSGEEEGLLGSYHYVGKDPIAPIAKTIYMINMDMVGYMKSNGNQLAALGGGTSEAGKKILEAIGQKYQDRKIKITEKAGGGSDHVPFMAKGVPGVFLHTGVSNNTNYHRTSDTAEKIDYAGMHMASKVAFELTFRMSNNESEQGLLLTEDRAPLVTEEEMAQTCHHLMKNPFVEEALNFSSGNTLK
jgi:hypothetical protein